MENFQKLGSDINGEDNLLDGFTLNTLIVTLHCNEQVIDESAVNRVVKEILKIQMRDLYYLLNRNMDEIIRQAHRA